jgi:leucyl aminopeptidase
MPKDAPVAHNLLARARADTLPVTVLRPDGYDAWFKKQPKARRDWLRQVGFAGAAGASAVLPPAEKAVAGAVYILGADADLWSWSALATQLPPGSYRLEGRLPATLATEAALGWGMTGYEFTGYRKPRETARQLVWPANADRDAVTRQLDAAFLVRDLINTPAEDLGPSELAAAARKLGRAHGAKTSVIVGDALLKANWPMIHMVGRASDDPPRLIDMRWGTRGPRISLVGKGVCFDTGGLDLKPAAGMLRMKKDMGGAAHVLGLASMIMTAKLPVRLRVMIGAVENAVAGNAYRPWDVLQTRKGITVENQNTDAEGRLVIGDCLYEASREKPDLLIDYATLTGASRVAVGTELAALYCNDDKLAADLVRHGEASADPMWRLPLYAPYRRMIASKVADISSASDGPFGGGITAALFLNEFVEEDVPWAHFDIMAWNLSSRPGRPEGGETQGMRAAYALIEERFGK